MHFVINKLFLECQGYTQLVFLLLSLPFLNLFATQQPKSSFEDLKQTVSFFCSKSSNGSPPHSKYKSMSSQCPTRPCIIYPPFSPSSPHPNPNILCLLSLHARTAGVGGEAPTPRALEGGGDGLQQSSEPVGLVCSPEGGRREAGWREDHSLGWGLSKEQKEGEGVGWLGRRPRGPAPDPAQGLRVAWAGLHVRAGGSERGAGPGGGP